MTSFQTLQHLTSFLNMRQAICPIMFGGLNGVKYLTKTCLCPCEKTFMPLDLSCWADFLILANLVNCHKMLADWKIIVNRIVLEKI
jgi:hypothetical protein